MADLRTAFDFSVLSPADCDVRRTALVAEMRAHGPYSDPEEELKKLQELSALTRELRRRNAGPPRKEKAKTNKTKQSVDSLLDTL